MKNVPAFPPRGSLPVYAIAFTILRAYYAVAARLRVEGLEHVPTSGGCVVVCNHTRGNDYFPLGLAAPRQIYYMVKSEAFRWNPVLGAILRSGGCIPVDRGAGDAAALDLSVQTVRDGHMLGMFPEGHRSPDARLQKGKTGAARIALHAGAPILPAAVVGAEVGYKNFPRFWKRPVILVRFGAPYVLEGADSDRAAVANGTRRIMRSIAALLPDEMRGEYSDAAEEARRQRVRAAPTAEPAE